MVRIEEGEVVERGLPKTGTLKDGTTISAYYILDDDILKKEGWLPLEDEKPEYDSEIQYLANNGYEILKDKVIKKYRIMDIPVRHEPIEILGEIIEIKRQLKRVEEETIQVFQALLIEGVSDD